MSTSPGYSNCHAGHTGTAPDLQKVGGGIRRFSEGLQNCALHFPELWFIVQKNHSNARKKA